MHPQVSDVHIPGHPRDVKENVIDQTRPPSSIAPWSSSDAQLPIVGAFGGWTGVSMAMTLTGLWLCSSKLNKLRNTLYSETFLSEPSLTFCNLSNNSSVGWHHAGQPCINERRNGGLRDPVPQGHHCSFLPSFPGPLLIDTDHCRLGKPHKSCSFGDALIQSSSHHNSAVVKLARKLTLVHFFPPTKRCHDKEIISVDHSLISTVLSILKEKPHRFFVLFCGNT